MTFISHSQNGEDILLNRAFKGVNDGFYIDIGACLPELDSVTKAFYDRGWNGVNVEPYIEHFKKLKEARKKDININQAIAEKKGKLLFHKKSFGEISALPFDEKDLPGFYASTDTLKSICNKYVKRPIDFLKIDVEGYEYIVIQSGNWEKYRPKVVLLEVTTPSTNNRTENAKLINTFLSEHGYKYVYFDGINDYYIAEEHIRLAVHFEFQPNCLDHYMRADKYFLQERLDIQWKETQNLCQINQELDYAFKAEKTKNNELWNESKKLRQKNEELDSAFKAENTKNNELWNESKKLRQKNEELDSAFKGEKRKSEELDSAFKGEKRKRELLRKNTEYVIVSLRMKIEQLLNNHPRKGKYLRDKANHIFSDFLFILRHFLGRKVPVLKKLTRFSFFYFLNHKYSNLIRLKNKRESIDCNSNSFLEGILCLDQLSNKQQKWPSRKSING